MQIEKLLAEIVIQAGIWVIHRFISHDYEDNPSESKHVISELTIMAILMVQKQEEWDM